MNPARRLPTAQQVLILDTGPLWELVLYAAVTRLRFESLRGNLQFYKHQSAYEQASRFIEGFQRRTTTPQVVAEISRHVDRTDEAGRPAIWSLVYEEFRSMGMEESLIRLLEMPTQLVAQLGAPDVSVLQLGQNLSRYEPVVLSIDGGLIAACRSAGVIAKHVWEVV